MAHTKDIVVVGASAGGVPALQELISKLPESFPASVFVVMHMSPHHRSELPSILRRDARLRVAHARDGEAFEAARVYVAPPDHHLLLDRGRTLLTRGPRENRCRPAIDVLFRSAAYAHGGRVVGVVLTGTLDDGTAGLWTIKHMGGTAVVQDPRDAEYSFMPANALLHVNADYVRPLAEISAVLEDLAKEPQNVREEDMSRHLDIEVRIARGEHALTAGVMELGAASRYTCPECGGVLGSVEDGGPRRFRCHTGHAYTLQALLADVDEHVENALASSLRALEEKLLLLAEAERLEPNSAPAPEMLAQRSAVNRQIQLVRSALKEEP